MEAAAWLGCRGHSSGIHRAAVGKISVNDFVAVVHESVVSCIKYFGYHASIECLSSVAHALDVFASSRQCE